MKIKQNVWVYWWLFAALFMLPLSGSTQSISGNVNYSLDKEEIKLKGKKRRKINLGYANVNIYKNGKLVANVLADAKGNFKVKLNPGYYRCEINYAGLKKVVKNIRVTKDEKTDFSLKADRKSKYSTKEITKMAISKEADTPKSATIHYSSDNNLTLIKMWGGKITNDSVSRLTAGEINDFAKWKLWADLTQQGSLGIFQQYWNISPTNRYTLQLKDQNGLPLANARVELLAGKKVLYSSKSDNTGKAELWETLKPGNESKTPAPAIRVSYHGKTEIIKKAIKFSQGVNPLVLKTACNQSQNVDIAIVVDATGSMQDEIDYLKSDLNKVIYQAKQFSNTLNLRFANVFYRDQGDDYLTKKQDFTNVLSEAVAYTNRHNADGGGDAPEAVETALDVAINQLSWRKNTRSKILFLVLDAPPHNTEEIQGKMRKLCHQAAKKGIRIVPIAASGSTKSNEYLMRCLALATNGTYLFLTGHSGIGKPHTKPSTDRYQVEILNDLLVRVIKSFTYMPDCQQQIADLGLRLSEAQVEVGEPTDNEAARQLQWKFYPNPTTGVIYIEANQDIKQLFISDLSGKAIKVVKGIKANTKIKVDLTAFASGMYLIRYPLGGQWISGKLWLRR